MPQPRCLVLVTGERITTAVARVSRYPNYHLPGSTADLAAPGRVGTAALTAVAVARLAGRPDPWIEGVLRDAERFYTGRPASSSVRAYLRKPGITAAAMEAARRIRRPRMGAWIRARDFDDVMTAFERAGAAIAPIYDVEQLIEDPQVKALDAITTIEDEDLGPLQMQNVMFRLSDSPGSIRFTVRRLGQDNEKVYGERLGLDPARIAELKADGAI